MTNDCLIAGAWDTHVHAGPDVTDRKHDIVELARHAAEAEMGGLVLKNHHFPTAMAAELVETLDIDIQLESTVVLNRSVGGLNLDTIRAAAEMGASRLEFPTMTAKRNMLAQGEPQTIDLLDDDGQLSTLAISVIDEALNHDMVIGTGHVGMSETEQIVRRVRELDGEIIITHPEFHAARDGVGLTPEKQAELAKSGVYFERCAIVADETVRELFPDDAPQTAHDAFADGGMFDTIIEGITATGAERNLLSTDYGQPERISPPAALAEFHDRVEAAGISRSEIEQMGRDNPEQLFGR